MKKIVSIFIFLTSLTLFGQNEDRVWYFGPSGTGLDFRNCTPVVKTNGNNNTSAWEGVVSICDASTGRLLFYSSGAKIIDSSFNVMPNGLNIGNGTSGTQSTIVRKPGSNNIFYYIVTDIQGGAGGWFDPNAKGISYTIIDMTLNGGLGDVVSAHNPIKDTSNCEKLTTVKNSNNSDVWLIAHEYNNNNFLVYNITSTGINLTPAIYSIGPVITASPSTTYASSRFDAIGELKASPDGSKLAYTTIGNGITCLFDFSKSTGVISNPIPLSLNGFGGYGVSFSPDNKKLYISCIDTLDFYSPVNSEIVQFDLSSNNQVIIQNSKQVINFCSSCSYRSLKLAPDGKIYCAKIPTIPESQYLAIINYPDSLGTSCNYVHNGIYLDGTYGSWGLNNLMESNNYCSTTNIESQIKLQEFLTLFPNPSNEKLIVKFVKNSEIEISNIEGQTLKTIKCENKETTIDLSNLSCGVYIIKAKTDKGIAVKKFIKQ